MPLFIITGSLLLLWLVLVDLIVTVRARRRDRESQKSFVFEHEYFSALAEADDTIHMLLSGKDSSVLYLGGDMERLWGISPRRVREDVRVLESVARSSDRHAFEEKWKNWDGKDTLVFHFTHEKDGEDVWYELTLSETKGGNRLFRFRENTREQSEITGLRRQVEQAAMEAK